MNPHGLRGRRADELLWFQRRGFLQAAATWSALCAGRAPRAQPLAPVVEQYGDVLVNGRALQRQRGVQPGDLLETGPDSRLTVVVGDSALHVRQNSRLLLQPGGSSRLIGTLRLLTGAVIGVWGAGTPRQLLTPTATIGIRGTGTYAEVFPGQAERTYFCTCYGRVELASAGQRQAIDTEYHQAYWAEAGADAGRLRPAPLLNHSDEELEYLARLIGQRTAWQISGRKGRDDGGHAPY